MPKKRGDTHTQPEAGAWGDKLLRLGVILGVFGTPLTFLIAGGNPFGPPKATILALATGLTAAGLALDAGAAAALIATLRRSRILMAAAAIVALSAASVFVAPSARQSLLGSFPDYRGLLSVVAFAVVAAGCVVSVRRDGGRVAFLRAASATLLAVSAIGVGEEFGLPPASVKLEGATRVISTAGNAANLGVLLTLLLPLAVWVAVRDKARAWRIAAAIGVAPGLAVLAWTLSRGAWVGVAAAGAVAAILYLAGRRADPAHSPHERVRALRLAGLLLVAVIAAAIVMPQIVGRAGAVLDAGSGTAYWRVSVWRSSADMMLERPVLGYGVNGFRYAYPQFQEPGQNDGRHGYLPIEAAHNLIADTAVSLGLLGLVALLVVGVEAAAALWRRSLAEDEDRMQAVAVSAALVGSVVALQFHYVTLDTGPLLVALLAVVAAWELAEEPRAAASSAPAPAVVVATRVLAAVLALAFAAVTIAAAGLVVADRESARAVALSRAGAPWLEVADVADRAQRLAPWESSIARAGGRAGTVRLSQTYEPDAVRDGLADYNRAIALSPRDPLLVYERANVFALASIGTRDPADLESALDGFEAAAAMDPNTGIPLWGQARVALVFGDSEAGISLLERCIELSPLYVPAWEDLAKAYRLAGQDEQARQAEEKAADLRR